MPAATWAYRLWGMGYGCREWMPGARRAKGLKGGLLPDANPVGLVSLPRPWTPLVSVQLSTTLGAGPEPIHTPRPSQTSHKVQHQHNLRPRRPLRTHRPLPALHPPDPGQHPNLDPATGNHLPSPCTSFTNPFIHFLLFFLASFAHSSQPDASTTPHTCSTPAPVPARPATSTATLPISSFGDPLTPRVDLDD